MLVHEYALSSSNHSLWLKITDLSLPNRDTKRLASKGSCSWDNDYASIYRCSHASIMHPQEMDAYLLSLVA